MSFNGKFSDECLNGTGSPIWRTTVDKITDWNPDYNHVRPHSSLGYKTPMEFASIRRLLWARRGQAPIAQTPSIEKGHQDNDKRRIFLYGYGSPRVTVLN